MRRILLLALLLMFHVEHYTRCSTWNIGHLKSRMVFQQEH
jgi:hypothetical protein